MSTQPGPGSKFVAGIIVAILVSLLLLVALGVLLRAARWAF